MLIDFVSYERTFIWKGYFYAVVLFLVAVIKTIALQHYYHGCYVTGMRIRTAMTSAVYRKVKFRKTDGCLFSAIQARLLSR